MYSAANSKDLTVYTVKTQRIYTGTFKILLIGALQFLYKPKSNPSSAKFLVTRNKGEDQNYDEYEEAIRMVEVHLIVLEQRNQRFKKKPLVKLN